MLINVYDGKNVETAADKGAMYFDTLPSLGDEIQFERRTFEVGRVWHLPSVLFAGAKLGILISETVDETVAPRTPTLASVA